MTAEERTAVFEGFETQTQLALAEKEIAEMEPALLDAAAVATLQRDFFPELGGAQPTAPSLLKGVIFDFDFTLAELSRPLNDLLEEGARAADAYMRSTGMQLPDEFYINIVEARRFAEEKSAEEAEEHLADDAMSFLLQFFGYPASKMDPDVLARAVDIFYAPEMMAWRLRTGVRELLTALREQGYKLALLANYNCDRVFQRTVDYLGLRDDFDVILSSASVEYRKPDARYFQIVLDRWDVLPYEVVVVGDSLVDDVNGGIELGAQTVLVCGETSDQVQHDNQMVADEVRPDAEIADLSELPALMQAWA